jgi:16S rRNA C967 or C1407 C5-methylase (RsmB/RsmF family)
MIPVCLVNVLENQMIIDFCAAPGSKTLQILEIMYNQAQIKNQFPSGLLISNELDVKRATMLIHLVQNHPTTNLVVTNTAAESFPSNKHIFPDVIFCDVPCSGDGTLRKNKGLRKRWKPDYGYNDHTVQIKILENAVRLAKLGGYIVYSTCSLNPIENEAVVCHILEKFKNQLELVEIKDKIMLSLKFSEGMTRWKVCDNWDKNGNKLEWAHEYSKIKKIKKYLIRESMFHEVYTLQNYSNNIFIVYIDN